jgi:hypothetical protein
VRIVEPADGVGEVDRLAQGEAEAAAERRVGRAHRVADGEQPGRDRGAVDHQAAQRVVQPAHRVHRGDRF